MNQLDVVPSIVDVLKDVHGIKAIVLGGSWAAGVQRPDSDIDLGLYYQQDDPPDIGHIQQIASELNDFADPIVSNLGEWGKWVNSIKPENFCQRIDNLLGNMGHDGQKLIETLFAAETLLREVIALCGDQYRPKY